MYGIFTFFIMYVYCYYLMLRLCGIAEAVYTFDIYGIPTENAILTTYQSNAKEMYVNLDAEKSSIW